MGLRQGETQIIEALATAAPPLLNRRFGNHSCIHATRVAVEVLKEFGMPARPLSVRATIINAKYIEATSLIGRPFESTSEAMKWHRETGAFSYGIGAKEAAGRWPGHLVAIARQSALIDLTIEQANHPKFDMILQPILTMASGRFLNGDEVLDVAVNGCRVIFEARVGDESFKDTPAWNDRECLSLAKYICEEIED